MGELPSTRCFTKIHRIPVPIVSHPRYRYSFKIVQNAYQKKATKSRLAPSQIFTCIILCMLQRLLICNGKAVVSCQVAVCKGVCMGGTPIVALSRCDRELPLEGSSTARNARLGLLKSAFGDKEQHSADEVGCYGTRSPLQDHTRIIDFTFRFPMLHGTVRHGKFHGNCSAAGIRA
jgi:hypothetical protein